MWTELDKKAISILKDNDRGGYTIPTNGLYPFQWNWDSAFVALGFATYDQTRAWQEIQSLLEGQWTNGFIPHIVFRKDDPSYFPGPFEWGTEHQHIIPTSGISQPPVLASIVRQMVETGDQVKATAHLKFVFHKILHWHRWFHLHRDPDNTGLIAVAHPWESGRDNLPDWDEPLGKIDVSNLVPYKRKDLSHVDSNMRPGKFDYDRYIKIVRFGKEHDWDQKAMAYDSPFFVADVGISAILMRADKDLRILAKRLGDMKAVAELDAWIEQGEKGFERFWNPKVGAYTSIDMRTNIQSDLINGGTFLAFYAGVVDEEKAKCLIGHLDDWWRKCKYGIPSFDPYHPEFNSIRYWRGPVWAVINWLTARGLADSGYVDRALRIRDSTQALVEKSGFCENFCPVTGMGCGGHDFSWTAAIWLDWLSPYHGR